MIDKPLQPLPPRPAGPSRSLAGRVRSTFRGSGHGKSRFRCSDGATNGTSPGANWPPMQANANQSSVPQQPLLLHIVLSLTAAYLAENSSKVSSWCSDWRRAPALKLAFWTKAVRATGRATRGARKTEPRAAARKIEADMFAVVRVVDLVAGSGGGWCGGVRGRGGKTSFCGV